MAETFMSGSEGQQQGQIPVEAPPYRDKEGRVSAYWDRSHPDHHAAVEQHAARLRGEDPGKVAKSGEKPVFSSVDAEPFIKGEVKIDADPDRKYDDFALPQEPIAEVKERYEGYSPGMVIQREDIDLSGIPPVAREFLDMNEAAAFAMIGRSMGLPSRTTSDLITSFAADYSGLATVEGAVKAFREDYGRRLSPHALDNLEKVGRALWAKMVADQERGEE